ncbi:MAG: hypothetical protein LBM65_07350 [Oscillospiraceae bacterium]|nr:hypothetical protein [Oscillospiraceae bacterium]
MIRNNFASVAKGVTIGLVAGATVGMVGKQLIQKNPKMRKKTKKAMRSIGNIVDTAQYMFR